MNITEVNIKLTEDPGERLQAFCSIIFDDCFVIRDLKIIEGSHGPFVAMPSRKLAARCPQCNSKNHLRASYCNQCGLHLDAEQNVYEQEGRAKLYADIAHPIKSDCREMIQDRVIEEFHNEVERSKHPSNSSREDGHQRKSVSQMLSLSRSLRNPVPSFTSTRRRANQGLRTTCHPKHQP